MKEFVKEPEKFVGAFKFFGDATYVYTDAAKTTKIVAAELERAFTIGNVNIEISGTVFRAVSMTPRHSSVKYAEITYANTVNTAVTLVTLKSATDD